MRPKQILFKRLYKLRQEDIKKYGDLHVGQPGNDAIIQGLKDFAAEHPDEGDFWELMNDFEFFCSKREGWSDEYEGC